MHPKTAQELARHSTITLTMDHYTHIGLHDLSAALESLPGLPTTESQAIRATGTEGVKNVVAGLVAGFGDNHCDSVRSIETRPTSKNTDDRHRSPLKDSPQLPAVAGSCVSLRPDEKESGSGWESNPPGDFSDATLGLKPRAVTRSAYTPR